MSDSMSNVVCQQLLLVLSRQRSAKDLVYSLVNFWLLVYYHSLWCPMFIQSMYLGYNNSTEYKQIFQESTAIVP